MDVDIKKEIINDGKTNITLIEPKRDYQFYKSYMFNVGLAQKYGVNEAIILQNMMFWIEKNKANNINYHNGYYWTFNSIKAFQELFPFWTYDQIRRLLERMEKKGILQSGNYNKASYDRTKWYTIKEKSLWQFCQIEKAEMTNESGENAKPIPYINTDKKPNINKDKEELNISLYGILNNVKLTKQHYEELIKIYPNDVITDYINSLSLYEKIDGYIGKDHYQVIRRWLHKDKVCPRLTEEQLKNVDKQKGYYEEIFK